MFIDQCLPIGRDGLISESGEYHVIPCLISCDSCDLSLSFSAAANLCFQEKSIYTQEVLAAVLQLLLEQDPIPVMFMRTVRPVL